MRKSPIRHHVRRHIRSNRPVHDYMRGKGDRPPKLAKPRLKKQQSAQLNYVVSIAYVKSPSETLQINAVSYPEAIETALIIRREFEPPHEIAVKRITR